MVESMVTAGKPITFNQPPPDKWYWTIDGGNVRFHVPLPPSWFHRLALRLVFGIRWERIES